MKIVRDWIITILILYCLPLLICKVGYELDLYPGQLSNFKYFAAFPILNIPFALYILFILIISAPFVFTNFISELVF